MKYNYLVWDNINIYPEHLSKEARKELRAKMSCTSVQMYCGCSAYSDNKLAYGISADLRFVPLHHGYVHAPECERSGGNGKRRSAYVLSDDGNARAFLKFNPFNFTVPKIQNEDSDEVPSAKERTYDKVDTGLDEKKESQKVENAEPAEPFDDLAQFVKNLNQDTYNARVMDGKGLLPADYFLNCVNGRLKNVYWGYMDRAVKDVTLTNDGVQFFYLPLADIEYGERNTITVKGYNRNYNYFLFPGTMQKELKLFEKRYGIGIDEALSDHKVVASGIIYQRLSKAGKPYKVVGRIHLFVQNANGLYCSSLSEEAELNSINQYLSENYRYKKVQFNRVMDDAVAGIFTCHGKKQVLLCRKECPEHISMTGENHSVCVVDEVTPESLGVLDMLCDC